MIYNTYISEGARVTSALFDCGRREAHAIIAAKKEMTFGEQLNAVEKAAAVYARSVGMTPVFKRYFLSDAANQAHLINSNQDCAVSRIQQPPLDGSKVSLWMVCQQASDYKECGFGVWMDSRGRMLVGDGCPVAGDSHDATVNCLSCLADCLEQCGSSLLHGCMRTWFMVHDVDRNYRGVVEGRNEEFDRRGLTRDTHFISSTGIGGSPVTGNDVVAFNAVCDTRLMPGQMGYLYGSSHLNPTSEYGVAFERGTTVDYRDRRKVYISGTASIDNKGAIVHPGDIVGQTRRMIENIGVLLKEAGCGFEDVAQLLVYLRDPADAAVVNSIYDEMMPEVPRVILLAPVCRPGWLVETECMAIRKQTRPEYDPF